MFAQFLESQGKLVEAINYYEKSIKCNQNYYPSYNNLGIIFSKNNIKKAYDIFKKGLRNISHINQNLKGLVNFYLTVGDFLFKHKDYNLARVSYNKALKIDVKNHNIITKIVHLEKSICNWRKLKNIGINLKDLGIHSKYVSPFTMFAVEDNPRRQLMRAIRFSKYFFKKDKDTSKNIPYFKNEKLKIGYFSEDLNEHPVGYQISQVLTLHDRKKFEIYVYSYSDYDKNDEIQRNLIKSVDHFKHLKNVSDEDIAKLVKQDRINIAIDLMGYTGNTRKVFNYRISPIQIHLFGGTLGSKNIDYLIADKIVIPKSKRKYYSENLIYLPGTYMPTNNNLEISNYKITKKNMKLPDNSFIFCNFNQSFKISMEEYEIWMRLLKQIDKSVLWLQGSNEIVKYNLKKEAEICGVNPQRIIFTDRIEKNRHLARHKLADLFLDTFNFNAQSTASDCLWSGLPLITRIGSQFVARSAASQLTAIGLPELITKTSYEYEKLALKIANDPNLLKKLKNKLHLNKKRFELFDTKNYTKNLEKSYLEVSNNYISGRGNKDIFIEK